MNAKRLSMVCFVCSYTLTTHIPDIWLHLVEQRDKYEAFLKELKKKWNSKYNFGGNEKICNVIMSRTVQVYAENFL